VYVCARLIQLGYSSKPSSCSGRPSPVCGLPHTSCPPPKIPTATTRHILPAAKYGYLPSRRSLASLFGAKGARVRPTTSIAGTRDLETPPDLGLSDLRSPMSQGDVTLDEVRGDAYVVWLFISCSCYASLHRARYGTPPESA
jgi:hypothetical protein